MISQYIRVDLGSHIFHVTIAASWGDLTLLSYPIRMVEARYYIIKHVTDITREYISRNYTTRHDRSFHQKILYYQLLHKERWCHIFIILKVVIGRNISNCTTKGGNILRMINVIFLII